MPLSSVPDFGLFLPPLPSLPHTCMYPSEPKMTTSVHGQRVNARIKQILRARFDWSNTSTIVIRSQLDGVPLVHIR